MTHAFSSLDELGRRPRLPQGPRSRSAITAFGVNGVVYPPGFPGVSHYHDTQDELYFVHSGTAKVRGRRRGADRSARAASSTSSRRRRAGSRTPATRSSCCSSIGGKDGYVERDGHVMSDEDLERRMNLGKEQA